MPSVHRSASIDGPPDRDLDRAGRRLSSSGWPLLVIGALLAAPGIVLAVVGSGAVAGVGVGLISLGVAVALVALGLLLSGLVSWWAARHKPFA